MATSTSAPAASTDPATSTASAAPTAPSLTSELLDPVSLPHGRAAELFNGRITYGKEAAAEALFGEAVSRMEEAREEEAELEEKIQKAIARGGAAPESLKEELEAFRRRMRELRALQQLGQMHRSRNLPTELYAITSPKQLAVFLEQPSWTDLSKSQRRAVKKALQWTQDPRRDYPKVREALSALNLLNLPTLRLDEKIVQARQIVQNGQGEEGGGQPGGASTDEPGNSPESEPARAETQSGGDETETGPAGDGEAEPTSGCTGTGGPTGTGGRTGIGSEKRAAKFRKMASRLDEKIEAKRNMFADANLTARRGRMRARGRKQARRMEQLQMFLRALADRHEQKDVPEVLEKVIYKKRAEALLWAVRRVENGSTPERLVGGYNEEEYEKMGINAPRPMAEAIHAAQSFLDGARSPEAEAKRKRKEKIQRLSEKAELSDIPGFFATPQKVGRRMAEELTRRVGAGGRFLEPSAGSGRLVEALQEVAGEEAGIKALEINPTLYELLTLKGIDAEREDFLELAPEGGLFDGVIMNPPFEKGAALKHVRHAYSMLAEGGALVSIVPESVFFRSDKKHEAFRAWMEERRVKTIDLEAGVFEQTSVKTRIIVLKRQL